MYSKLLFAAIVVVCWRHSLLHFFRLQHSLTAFESRTIRNSSWSSRIFLRINLLSSTKTIELVRWFMDLLFTSSSFVSLQIRLRCKLLVAARFGQTSLTTVRLLSNLSRRCSAPVDPNPEFHLIWPLVVFSFSSWHFM